MVEEVDALHYAGEHGLDLLESAAITRPGLAYLEDARFSLVQQLAHVFSGRAERYFGNIGCDLREFPLHRALAHQFGVAADVQRAGRILRKRAKIGHAPGLVPVLARLDRFENRDDVGGAARFDQLADVTKNPPVIVAVEIVDRDQIRDLLPGLVVQQQPAKQRLLGLDRVRRYAQRKQLRVSRFDIECCDLGCARHGERACYTKQKGLSPGLFGFVTTAAESTALPIVTFRRVPKP